MYHFKQNFALQVSNLDNSIAFYQKALAMTMYSLNEENTEAVLENPCDKTHLLLSCAAQITPNIITISAKSISESLAWHEELDCVSHLNPKEAVYNIVDPDGHTIVVQAEYESVVIKTHDKPTAIEDENLDGLSEE